jgi:hypothetical protein
MMLSRHHQRAPGRSRLQGSRPPPAYDRTQGLRKDAMDARSRQRWLLHFLGELPPCYPGLGCGLRGTMTCRREPFVPAVATIHRPREHTLWHHPPPTVDANARVWPST